MERALARVFREHGLTPMWALPVSRHHALPNPTLCPYTIGSFVVAYVSSMPRTRYTSDVTPALASVTVTTSNSCSPTLGSGEGPSQRASSREYRSRAKGMGGSPHAPRCSMECQLLGERATPCLASATATWRTRRDQRGRSLAARCSQARARTPRGSDLPAHAQRSTLAWKGGSSK